MKLYLLCYNRKPIRQKLLQLSDLSVKEKHLKHIIFLQIKKLWISFNNPLSTCTMISILRNI